MSILAPPYLNSPSENNHIDAPDFCRRRLEIRDISPILIRSSEYYELYTSNNKSSDTLINIRRRRPTSPTHKEHISKYKSIFDLDLELGESPPKLVQSSSDLSEPVCKTNRWYNIYNYFYNYNYKFQETFNIKLL